MYRNYTVLSDCICLLHTHQLCSICATDGDRSRSQTESAAAAAAKLEAAIAEQVAGEQEAKTVKREEDRLAAEGCEEREEATAGKTTTLGAMWVSQDMALKRPCRIEGHFTSNMPNIDINWA